DLKKQDPNILTNIEIKKEIALEFENAAIETLVYKTKKAIEKYKVKTLIVAGGVSANKYLKKEIQKLPKQGFGNLNILFPNKKLTGDNSIMIGVAGYFQYIKNGISKNTLSVKGNLSF
ncbi:MAG: tRNA (adenosine(37)-N6)-threonylcarbamoyltransferase complex transferase subunit TsaD, partial [Patescibacteria group bacterium]